jgi:hypothetical protein
MLLHINLSLTSREFFPYCALNIRCNLTGDIVSASHITHWDFSCIEAIFKKKFSISAYGGKNSTLNIPVWKLYECPSLPAAKFIQLVCR